MGSFYRAGTLASVSVLALCLAAGGSPAQAQSFTVSNGQTVGQQVMTGAGDTGHIQQGGEIETVGVNENALEMQADDQSLLNEGTVSTSGDLSLGILSIGDNAAITNDGMISTTGADALGVLSVGADAAITNSGTISTTGADATALQSGGGRAVISNSGTISATGNFANGILSAGFDAVIDNSGTISTTGLGAHGLYSTGPDLVFTNSGDLSTTGDSSQGVLSSGFDAVLTNSGTISTTGTNSHGFDSAGPNAVLANDGTITTQGLLAFGIRSSGTGAVITNSGSISTLGASEGVVSNGARATITNSGTVSTVGLDSEGISSNGPDAVILNSGTLTTEGNGSDGIHSTGPNAVITNSGTLSTAGDGAAGIAASDLNAAIKNTGTLSTTGTASYGIYSSANNAVIENSGTISTTSMNALGIWASQANAVVTNSGTITSEQASSIGFGGANATLNLLGGSVLKGNLQFIDPGSATLNIGPGLSAALQVNGIPTTINAFGMPLVVTANAVYTADVTALGSEGEALADLTGGIFSAIGGRRGGEGAAVPLSYAPDKAPQTKVFRTDDVPVREAWLKGFGGMRDDDGSSTSAAYDQALAGIVSGVDVFASATGVAGIFLGGSWAKTEVELSQDVEAQSGFGGVYGTFGLGSASLDVAFAAGFSSYDSERRVNNSLVGLETAEAEYDGWFVSPHLALTQPFVVGGRIVEAKVSAHYAGLFLDGYEESGSAANLSVDERDVHVFVGRAGLSVPVNVAHAGGGVTTVTPSLGVEGRAQFGDTDVGGSFIGTDIVIDLDDGGTIGGFAGLKIEHETAAGLTFFAATEGLIEEDASRFFAKGGVRVQF